MKQIHHYNSESKQESMPGIKKLDGAPKKFKVEKSVFKIMLTIFWDSKGILLFDYRLKGAQTIVSLRRRVSL